MPAKAEWAERKPATRFMIGALPNLFTTPPNNPSEATIAKQRGYCATTSYLTPPAAERRAFTD